MIARFLAHLRDQDRSPHTIDSYRFGLKQFFTWFEKASPTAPFDPARVTPLDIREWRRELQAQRQKPGTINQKINLLTSFFDWCQAEKLLASNPARGIARLKQATAAPKWLTRPQTYALLRTVEERVQLADVKRLETGQWLTRRNAAMIALMLHAGLRVAEVCALQPADVHLFPKSGRVVIRHGKGNKYREVPLNIDARRALTRWQQVSPAQKGGLFDRNGKPLHPRTVQQHLAELGRLARLEIKLTPHMLRHTFGKNLADAGIPLDRIAMLMGHSSVETTSIYTMPGAQDLQAAVDKIAWTE
jgi:integrase/recombinase XerC